jgi:hypothetical protein
MSEKHTVNKLGKTFGKFTTGSIASSSGKGSRKDLFIRVICDGYAIMGVEFVVEDHGEQVAFTTFDAAVDAYNEAS